MGYPSQSAVRSLWTRHQFVLYLITGSNKQTLNLMRRDTSRINFNDIRIVKLASMENPDLDCNFFSWVMLLNVQFVKKFFLQNGPQNSGIHFSINKKSILYTRKKFSIKEREREREKSRRRSRLYGASSRSLIVSLCAAAETSFALLSGNIKALPAVYHEKSTSALHGLPDSDQWKLDHNPFVPV